MRKWFSRTLLLLLFTAAEGRADSIAFGVAFGEVRGFIGSQINLLALALFGQLSADMAHDLSVNTGLRLFR